MTKFEFNIPPYYYTPGALTGFWAYGTTRPRKTEYEIETKETMQREQKGIVLRTKEYCMYCVQNKGGRGDVKYIGLEDAVRCKENALANTENRRI